MDNILLTGLTTASASILTYLLTRKKQNADIRATEASTHINELTATEKAVAIWRSLSEDLSKEVTELRNLIGELRVENEKLHAEIANLREELVEYKLKLN